VVFLFLGVGDKISHAIDARAYLMQLVSFGEHN